MGGTLTQAWRAAALVAGQGKPVLSGAAIVLKIRALPETRQPTGRPAMPHALHKILGMFAALAVLAGCAAPGPEPGTQG